MRIKKYLALMISIPAFLSNVYSQDNYRQIPLPVNINSVNEEYSGMTIWKSRLYLLPQYGSRKETKLDGDFFIYTISCDSVGGVIDRKDSGLTAYRSIKVNNLQKLPDSIKKYYEGFEAITIVNGKVFLSIETTDTYDSCYLLKGKLDTNKNEINIDPVIYAAIKRYPYIVNAGFESVTYLPQENKLLALYEYNGMTGGGIGFLIDTAFKKPLKKINAPFLYFRLTDITATSHDKIYGINYFWNGDYNYYLDNNLQRHEEENIKNSIPDLKKNLNADPGYLKKNSTCYARIIMIENYRNTKWKQVVSFECAKNNWEGLALFRKGALVITDANRSSHQATTLAYVSF
ncbi:MAG: hypothetical protein ABI863_02095 [Ginsengibacter sp.]